MPRGRPVIGLNCDFTRDGESRVYLRPQYLDAVSIAGGLPVMLPPVRRKAEVRALLDRIDGLILTGANDYAPALYGAKHVHPEVKRVAPRRQRFDMALAREAIDRGMPVLGICGGAQLIAVACGGTIRQHLPRHPRGGTEHAVEIARSSRLAALAGRTRVQVNSYHHQAVHRPGDGLRITARADDGVVEGIEAEERFLVGVQWHPELEIERRLSRALFRAVVREAES